MLFVTSSIRDETLPNIYGRIENITEENRNVHINFVSIKEHDLIASLEKEMPDILHIEGHEDMLFAVKDGTSQLSHRAIRLILQSLSEKSKWQLQCIVLMSCDTDKLDEDLLLYTPIVIGAKPNLHVDSFISSFYLNICKGENIKAAYKYAVEIATLGGKISAEDVPVFLERKLKGDAVDKVSTQTQVSSVAFWFFYLSLSI